MKLKFITIFVIALLTFESIYSQKYSYTVDLINVKSDKVSVELICPKIKTDSIKFKFPAIIPGHHFMVNYGRFIEDLQAFDKTNNLLHVKRKGLNDFEILNASDLYKITYNVNDTKDSKEEEKVMGWSSTNFIKNELFIINPGGVFGFFEHTEQLPAEIIYKKPSNLYGSTSLKMVEENKSIQKYIAESYHQLIDCPVLFSKPDTAGFFIQDTKINVACYNEAGIDVAAYIVEKIEPKMQAVLKFSGNKLPVEKYTFILFFEDYTNAKDMIYNDKVTPVKMLTKILMKHGRPMPGALEHNNSSFHSLMFLGKKESIDDLLNTTVIHEFMHIYTPLNLHSNILENFNYSEPDMSKHLWLYEGITEYLSKLIELKSGLIDQNIFLTDIMRPKIVSSYSYPKDMIFTEMSKNIFESPYKEQFMQVYNRGAVIAFLLDFEIIKLTTGTKDLKQVFFSLVNKYGKDKPFNEETFIKEFVGEVHPDLQSFFDNYIQGSEKLPIENSLKIVGLDFQFKQECQVPVTILGNGNGVIDVMEAFGFYTINEVTENSPFKEKDKIRSNDMGSNCLKPFIDINGDFIKKGESIKLPVFREGNWIEIDLTPEFKLGTYYCKIKANTNPTKTQQKYFTKWINN